MRTRQLRRWRRAGKAVLSDFTFSKKFNSQSPNLFKFCAQGKHIPTVVLQLLDNKGQVVAEVKMIDVLVSSYQTGGGGGTDIIDQVSLNFAQIDFTKVLIGL